MTAPTQTNTPSEDQSAQTSPSKRPSFLERVKQQAASAEAALTKSRKDKADAAPAEGAAEKNTSQVETAQDAPSEEEILNLLPEEGPVAELLKTMVSLEETLADETNLMAANDPDAMYEVQKRKTQLAAAYETRVKGLTDDPEPLQELDEETRAQLRERMVAFDQTVRRNARSINAARAITEDLLRTTVEIVKKHRRENGVYAQDGGRRDEAENASAPISVNKSL